MPKPLRSLLFLPFVMLFIARLPAAVPVKSSINAGGAAGTGKIIYHKINYVGQSIIHVSTTEKKLTKTRLAIGPDPAFKLGEVYCFPNPAKRGKKPIIHVETGIADAVYIHIYDVAGDLVHQAEITAPPDIVDDGQGVQYAYEYTWDGSIPSGTYICKVRTSKKNESDLTATTKLAVIR